jgi:hypothetical protein
VEPRYKRVGVVVAEKVLALRQALLKMRPRTVVFAFLKLKSCHRHLALHFLVKVQTTLSRGNFHHLRNRTPHALQHDAIQPMYGLMKRSQTSVVVKPTNASLPPRWITWLDARKHTPCLGKGQTVGGGSVGRRGSAAAHDTIDLQQAAVTRYRRVQRPRKLQRLPARGASTHIHGYIYCESINVVTNHWHSERIMWGGGGHFAAWLRMASNEGAGEEHKWN